MPSLHSDHERAGADESATGRGSSPRAPGRSTLTSRLPASTQPQEPQPDVGVGTPAFKTSPAVAVSFISPKPGDIFPGDVLIEMDVAGPPDREVTVYWTLYNQGNVAYQLAETTKLDAAGKGFHKSTYAPRRGEHFALHARAEGPPGVFSPLRVVEFDSV